MLRPPSEYESTRVELSNRVAKINNLFFDSAVIFFTPKVADKGVNLANLQCTIVQITDRGAWGKEEETFTVDASSFSNRKYRSFDLTTDAEYSLKIIPPPELRMGFLEVYFDPTISNQSNYTPPIMGVNNPVTLTQSTIDTAALAQAIGSQMGAALANQASVEESRNSTTSPTLARAWTGDINNHRILAVNPVRLGVHIMHPGKTFVPTNANDVYIAVGNPAGRDNTRFDYLMNPLGDYNCDPERETLAVYAWVAPGKPDTLITVTEYLP